MSNTSNKSDHNETQDAGNGSEQITTKKKEWTSHEDELLKEFVKKYGAGKWNEVPEKMGICRDGKSCRLRWVNHLNPLLKKGPYTPEEEYLLAKLHNEHGNKWALIAQHIPGRTDNDLKNHWHTHCKKCERANLPKYPSGLPEKEQDLQRGSSQSNMVPPGPNPLLDTTFGFMGNGASYPPSTNFIPPPIVPYQNDIVPGAFNYGIVDMAPKGNFMGQGASSYLPSQNCIPPIEPYPKRHRVSESVYRGTSGTINDMRNGGNYPRSQNFRPLVMPLHTGGSTTINNMVPGTCQYENLRQPVMPSSNIPPRCEPSHLNEALPSSQLQNNAPEKIPETCNVTVPCDVDLPPSRDNQLSIPLLVSDEELDIVGESWDYVMETVIEDNSYSLAPRPDDLCIELEDNIYSLAPIPDDLCVELEDVVESLVDDGLLTLPQHNEVQIPPREKEEEENSDLFDFKWPEGLPTPSWIDDYIGPEEELRLSGYNINGGKQRSKGASSGIDYSDWSYMPPLYEKKNPT